MAARFATDAKLETEAEIALPVALDIVAVDVAATDTVRR
jgi:hypothetical protein